jgi:hypothetical protein
MESMPKEQGQKAGTERDGMESPERAPVQTIADTNTLPIRDGRQR